MVQRTFPMNWARFKNGLSTSFPPKPTFLEHNLPNLDGRVIGITGGSSGVGYETVKLLASHTNAKFFIFVRNLDVMQDKMNGLAKQLNKPIDYKIIKLDYNDLSTIKPAADEFLRLSSRLDVMFHNVGVMDTHIYHTKYGFDTNSQINVFGPFILQQYLNDIMQATANTLSTPNEVRIVWVGSNAYIFGPKTILNFDDPFYKSTTMENANEAYGQSKGVLAIVAANWNAKFGTNFVSSYLCPGIFYTGLQKDMSKLLQGVVKYTQKKPKWGAYTLIFSGFSPEVTVEKNGHYIAPLGRFDEFIDVNLYDTNAGKIWQWVQDSTSSYINH